MAVMEAAMVAMVAAMVDMVDTQDMATTHHSHTHEVTQYSN